MGIRRPVPFPPGLMLLSLVILLGITAGNLWYRARLSGLLGTSIERRIMEDGTVFDIRDGEEVMWLREISPDGTLKGSKTLSKKAAGRNDVTVAYHIFAIKDDTIYMYRFEQPDASERLENISVVACDTHTWDISPVCDLIDGGDILFADAVAGGSLYFAYTAQGRLDVFRIDPQSKRVSEWKSADTPFPVSWFTVTEDGTLCAASPDSAIYRYKEALWTPVFRPEDTSSIVRISTGTDGSLYVFLMGQDHKDSLLRIGKGMDTYITLKDDISGLFDLSAFAGDTWVGITKERAYRLTVSGQAYTVARLRVPFRLLWDGDMLSKLLPEAAAALALMLILYALCLSWRRRRMGLLLKLVAVAVPIFGLGAFVMTQAASGKITELIYKDVRVNLLTGAKTVSEKLDARRFGQIDWSQPLSDEYYLALREEMGSLSKALAFEWADTGQHKPSFGHLYINYWIYRVEADTVRLAVCDDFFINRRLEYYYSSKPLSGGFETLLKEPSRPVFTPLYSSDDEGNWLSLLYPVFDGEGLTAILEVSSPIWNIEHTAKEITGYLLLFSCAVLASMLTAFLAVLTVSLRTLKRLKHGAAAISGGDYSVRVEDKSSDETGEIAAAFNNMAASVESIMADITATSEGYSRFVPGEMLSLMRKNSIRHVSFTDYIALKAMFMLLTTDSFDKYREQAYIGAMNRFYACVLPVLSGSGGVVERFNGRELRALFDCKPETALDTALALFDVINRHNAELTAENDAPVECGVLLAYSDTFFGVTGNDQRLNMVLFSRYAYAVDSLRETGLRFGCRLMLDQSAYEGLCGTKKRYRHRLLGYILDAGEKRAVYDFYDSETAERARARDVTCARFVQAVELYYGAAYDAARALFIEILKESPDDFAAREYLKKSHAKLDSGAAPDMLLEI